MPATCIQQMTGISVDSSQSSSLLVVVVQFSCGKWTARERLSDTFFRTFICAAWSPVTRSLLLLLLLLLSTVAQFTTAKAMARKETLLKRIFIFMQAHKTTRFHLKARSD